MCCWLPFVHHTNVTEPPGPQGGTCPLQFFCCCCSIIWPRQASLQVKMFGNPKPGQNCYSHADISMTTGSQQWPMGMLTNQSIGKNRCASHFWWKPAILRKAMTSTLILKRKVMDLEPSPPCSNTLLCQAASRVAVSIQESAVVSISPK